MRAVTRVLGLLLLVSSLAAPWTARADGRTQGAVRIVAYDDRGRPSKGSGFIVQGERFIVTAYHVVYGASRIEIDRPAATRVKDVGVLGLYPKADLALLELPVTLERARRPYPAQTDLTRSTGPIELVGYGTIIARVQSYAGQHTNRPSIPAGEWMNFDPDVQSPLLFATKIDLMMLQAPVPFGLSGGAILNPDGEAIGVFSGALTRDPNEVALAWAIPLRYIHAPEMQRFVQPRAPRRLPWDDPGIIAEPIYYRRAFGQPRGSLLGDLRCPGEAAGLEQALDRTVAAAVELRQKYENDRIMIDRAVRNARSKDDADQVIAGFVQSMRGRLEAVKEDANAFNRKTGLAFSACLREMNETQQIVDSFPATSPNRAARARLEAERTKLADELQRLDQASTTTMARFSAEIGERIGRGMSGSRSIEGKIATVNAMIDSYQQILGFMIVGEGAEINRQLMVVAEEILGWLETADRQPWDRA